MVTDLGPHASGALRRDGTPGHRPPRRTTVLLAGLPFACSLAIMLVGIGDRQLWRDENATWWAASLPLNELAKLVQSVDAVNFLYYVVMHFWIDLFGDTETSLRMPSALCVSLAAAVLALVGRTLFETRVGLLAGLLLPLVPAISRYGQEARPYAMALLATVVAVWQLQRALDRRRPLRWLCYSAAVIWVGFSHVIALMAIPAHLALVVDSSRGGSRGSRSPAAIERSSIRALMIGWAMAVATALLVICPMIIVSSGQQGQISWVPAATVQRALQLPGTLFLSAPIAGFFVVAGCAAMAALAGGGRVLTAAFFALWTVAPPIITYALSSELRFFYPRYLLFTVPGWVLLAGWALCAIAPNRRQLLATFVATAVGLAFLGMATQREIRTDRIDNEVAYRDAGAFIAQRSLPGDGIVFAGYPFAHRGFRYEWRHLPTAAQPKEILADVAPDRRYTWDHPACANPVACLGETQRIWLVFTDTQGDALDPLPDDQQKAVEAHYALVSTTRFHRVSVKELVRKRDH